MQEFVWRYTDVRYQMVIIPEGARTLIILGLFLFLFALAAIAWKLLSNLMTIDGNKKSQS